MNPRTRDGKPYEGNQMFMGNGVQRSCSKCGTHHPPGKLKKLAPWGLCCESCRLPRVPDRG